MNGNKIFIMYSTCVPVKGAKRSAIYDLQRQELSFIPNDLYDMISRFNKNSVEDILKAYPKTEEETILEYLEYLISGEFAFMGSSDDAILISDLNLEWDYFGKVSNSIFEYSHLNQDYFKIFTKQLNELGCSALQIISYRYEIPDETLDNFLDYVQFLKFIDHVELLVPYSENYNSEMLTNLMTRYFKIDNIFVHSSPFSLNEREGTLVFTTEIINSNQLCGQVQIRDFSLNISHFSEAKSHNSCLNRKISVDESGRSKNCPSMINSYGHISNTQLIDVITRDDFRAVWKISKDQVEVCRDCEFRYSCTDCRVYLAQANNLYSKPAKCKYDPYTATWSDQ